MWAFGIESKHMRVDLKVSQRANLVISLFAAQEEKSNGIFLLDLCQEALDKFVASVEDSKLVEIENLYELLKYNPLNNVVSGSSNNKNVGFGEIVKIKESENEEL